MLAERYGQNVDLERLAHRFATATEFWSSPLYRALCPVVAEDRQILELVTVRQPGPQPTFLFFGAVHFLLLSGVDHELREFFPSIVDGEPRDPAAAGPVLQAFCQQYADEIGQLLRTRLVQTNVVKRSAALRLGLWAIRQETDAPVHLIEIGASAGIHLRFDRYGYTLNGMAFGDRHSPVVIDTEWRSPDPPPDLDALPAVASATGIDLHPVVTDDDRLWLRALVWPEDRAKAELLTAALAIVAADPPQIRAGDAIELCEPLSAELPAGEPRVVFHAATRIHVPRDRRPGFDRAIERLGDTGPLFQVAFEELDRRASADRGSMLLTLRGPGDEERVALAAAGGHVDWAEPLR